MASTTFSGPVTSTNGFVGAVTGNVTGDVTGDITGGAAVTYLQLPTITATGLADVANAVNTANKAAGSIVFETTNSKLKIATGALAASTWVDADGTNAVTPS